MPKFTLSPVQKFPVESDLFLQPLSGGWAMLFLTNQSLPVFDFMKNTPQSAKFTYKLKPKSSYATYTQQGYTNLKVRGTIELPVGDPSWVSVSSDWFPVANYTNLNQSQFKDIDFMISPPLTISQGVHTAKVKFHIEGVKNGVTEILSTYEIPVVLNVFEEGYFYSPNDFTYYYYSGLVPVQLLKIGGNNWQVNAPVGLTLTGNNVVQNPDGSYKANDSGLKNFNVGLAANIGDLLGENESITLPITVVYLSGTFTIPVKIIQAGSYYPTKTTFSIQNGQVDKLFQMIHLTRTDNYLVDAPANIGFENLNTSEGKKLKIFILDPDAFGSGVFKFNLGITYPDALYFVEITVNVGNQFDLGIDQTTVFTNSMKDLVFSTNNQGSYIDMTLSVVGSQNSYNYQFPFFKGSAKKNIGKALSNFIDYENSSTLSIAAPVLGTYNWERSYPLSYFNVNVKERKNDVDLLAFGKSNVPFMLGYKPIVIDNKAILQHNNFSRFTSKSFALINVYALNGVFDYQIKKNNLQVHSVVQEFGYIKTIKLNFESYNAVAGDIFDFILKIGNEEIKKSFVIFPEVLQNINLVYVDSFGLNSCINFTGNTKNVNSQITLKLENYMKANFLQLRKYVEKESSTIFLNTGFILKSQSLEISELLRSKKAWIVINDHQILEVVPKTEKITEIDNDNYLYDYQIEFEINKANYAQDYNF